jgi:flagellar biosynthesis repressor protein FlbT
MVPLPRRKRQGRIAAVPVGLRIGHNEANGEAAMSLKVELKPGEKLLIGNCVVTNADQRTRLFIDGKAPILREKDILTAETANSPAKRIYLAVQLMYIREDVEALRRDYFQLINDIVKAAPSTVPIVDEINNEILTGSLYKALKAAKKLIQYEQDLLSHAK